MLFYGLDEPEEYCFKISASYDSTTPSYARSKIVKINRGFARDVSGCHVGVQVVPMIIIYQEKILLTYFNLNSFTSVINIKLIKFQGNAHSSLFATVKPCTILYSIEIICKLLYWYQEFLCPVEPLYFSDEKSAAVEK